MKCPNCDATLVMADRSGVEIDYCPSCRGVWLDRGELDKIIERSMTFNQQPQQTQRPPQQQYGHDKDHRHSNDPRHNDEYYKKKKRDSFLGDLFDF
jgi:uncharacterized protein